ncbi:hypothetical protein ACFQI5_11325 [Mammaliicoccus vitulinus]
MGTLLFIVSLIIILILYLILRMKYIKDFKKEEAYVKENKE